MKFVIKTKEKTEKDDSLFGLLSQHKIHVTYFRIMVNEAEKKASFQISSNPKFWANLPAGKYDAYRMLKRSEIGVTRLSVKYIFPEQLILYFTPTFGIKFPVNKIEIDNSIGAAGKNYFTVDFQIKYLSAIVLALRKLIALAPQKKYEIIETYLLSNPTGAAQ